MKHGKVTNEVQVRRVNPVHAILGVLIFGVGAALLFLVLTGRVGNMERPYATGDLGPDIDMGSSSSVSGEPATVAEGLERYSWEDLSRISSEIEATPDRGEAIKLAASYGLVTDDGQVLDESKLVTLSDGTEIRVGVAGILRDPYDGGTAGLTFVCLDAAAIHNMNDTDTIQGGWEGSGMRAWLNSEMLDMLPDDLKAVIRPVQKRTNNVGPTSETSAVTTTTDALWLLSAREVVGEQHWTAEEYGEGYSHWDNVLNEEGSQYANFSQNGVTSKGDPNGVCSRTYQGKAVGWYYRSAMNVSFDVLEGEYFYGALDSGFPHNLTVPSEELGVVFGFAV